MQLLIKNILPTYFQETVKERSEIWGKELLVEKGELIKVVAPSGSGKSSLINFLYGLRKDFNGNIRYNNKEVTAFSAEELAALRKDSLSIVFQDLRLFPEQTVTENLEIKRQLNPFHPAEKIKEMGERLGIGSRLHTKAKVCSYGEQQRTAIIRSLLQPFDILLLDEPFSHLDDKNAQRAMELMLEEARLRNAAIIFADLERIDYFPFTRLFHL
ncbi:MAG TPA: ATP-binding cassette domain-containing protein [Chitinophagaceae bacterium]